MKQASSHYSNFRDPLGLLSRMIRSGDRAAWSALIHAGLGLFAGPLDRLLQSRERRLIEAARSSDLPIILIVGPPRGGTTLVYQTLAHFLPVDYFSNLSELFPRSPIAATRLFRVDRRRSTPDFQSYFGNTAGPGAPNDGFHVWNRWLGHDRYRTAQELDEAAVADMNRFFDAWLTAFGKPLVNKNNRNTDCIALLARSLDRARFVVVRRDPVFIVQSLIKARQQIQGRKAHGWGLLSRDQDPGDPPDGYIDAVCDQVHRIEMKIQSELRRIDPARRIEISYEEFCANPAGAVASVSKQFLDRPIDETELQKSLKPFQNANQPRLGAEEMDRIRSRLTELFSEPAASAGA